MEVLIIGAGLSGVGAAIALHRAGFGSVAVLEKSPRLGGTWRDNTYPGCGCDVPSMLYEYSFAPHDWPRVFASQPEILRYIEATAAAHGVADAIRYGVEVQTAAWDGLTHRWRLETTAGPYSAHAVIVATGPWHRPRYPDIAQLAEFPGAVFHSAEWDHGTDLTGRRVAVVGTGASTVQLLPEIQPHVARAHVFQSSASWVLPKPDQALPPPLHRFLKRRPAVRRALRAGHYWTQEGIGYCLRHPRTLPTLESLARLHLRSCIADPALRKALIPRHRLGARRLLTSNAYYRALACPNVQLHPTRVTRVQGQDVIGADGTRVTVDTIVLATGFHVGDIPLAHHVRGRLNETLAQTWRGGRRAYLGTSVHGYPNLFLLLGPNILSGTAAVPNVLEAQLRYITDALKYLRGSQHASLEVLAEVQNAHNVRMQQALRNTVYTADRTSYYFSQPGMNTFCWPWSSNRLRRLLHSFDPKEYAWHEM
ncbi:NAD(P)/FAD-dependent oxidoreductase [Streptomyces sp. NPDC048106]|uniref:flavin-containing monooxygenase n=1 Tax=Streptomyces sp. NPDC048106 TaxID=3155750 RepID=UPI0034516C0D